MKFETAQHIFNLMMNPITMYSNAIYILQLLW